MKRITLALFAAFALLQRPAGSAGAGYHRAKNEAGSTGLRGR